MSEVKSFVEFQIGDVVKLKSDVGTSEKNRIIPICPMVIAALSPMAAKRSSRFATCVWMDVKNHQQQGTFNFEVLKKIS